MTNIYLQYINEAIIVCLTGECLQASQRACLRKNLGHLQNEWVPHVTWGQLIVCFTSYFVFSIAVLPHSPGVVYYHLLLRRETRIRRVAPFSFRIRIWDLFVHRGQTSYTLTAFGKLWTTPGVRCMKHASS